MIYQLVAEKEYAPAQVRLASFLKGKVQQETPAAKQLLLQAVNTHLYNADSTANKAGDMHVM